MKYYLEEEKAEIEQIYSKFIKDDPEKWVEGWAKSTAKMLDKNKSEYKRFGVYWWAIKDLLRKYAPDKGKWYCGTDSDATMKKNAWHGDEYRTLVAGIMCFNDNGAPGGVCTWTDKNGELRQYVVYDEDAMV